MRIIAISDTHRNYFNLEKIILKHMNSCDFFIHLGDGQIEISTLLNKYPEIQNRFFTVRGNCDSSSFSQNDFSISVDNHRIFASHGHNYAVKYCTDIIISEAVSNNCDIVLFGHSHTRLIDYKDGIHIMNPGSASSPRDGKSPSYGMIDITKNGVHLTIVDV